ncbi:uncharacterized protein LOC142566189 [Dermacentor variabilis]|uniref:uncharacterized protein LOC142566189 n=1 Tax=Dermacentor variabilis TaxID=34621 RepID=UPI003F5B64EE
MAGRTWTTKFATKHRFGSRKRKPPNIRRISRPSGDASAHELARETVDALPGSSRAVTALCSSGDNAELITTFSDAFGPSTSCECPATYPDCATAVTEMDDESAVQARASVGREDEPCISNGRTIQSHHEPQFILSEELNMTAATVRASLVSVPATERKIGLMAGGACSVATDSSEFLLVQVAALNALLSKTRCHQCFQPGIAVVPGTRLGLAVKMVLHCSACGTSETQWSSPREEGSRAFEVNLRSMQAIKSIGKGATALTDFWSVMNVSYRGLHQKTFQGHLKAKFRPAASKSATNACTDAVAAVKRVYTEMDPTFHKNITVIYDGTWMTRGHSSHIGVGAVIEFYSGLVLDFVVLSNYCHGCMLGPKPGDSDYDVWRQAHQCQKNTDVKSGRMEVEAALELFRRSLTKNDLRYTNIVCDGDSRTYLALCEDQTYGFIQFSKEDCVNHVEKRMGTNLRTLVTKSSRDQPLGGRGGLTQDLIKRLTSYYGMALRGSEDVKDMKRAVMATFHHVTSTDEEPHHELCPVGPSSWCRHRAAEAKQEPQPAHKYRLKPHVAEAMLPVFQRLSEPQLLERCKGKKTQNAAESLHSVIWSIMPEDKNASLIAVETAVSEAVCRFNSGTLRAYTEFCTSLGVKPAGHGLRRAAEKDALRKKRAQKAHEEKHRRFKKPRDVPDTCNYKAGGF